MGRGIITFGSLFRWIKSANRWSNRWRSHAIRFATRSHSSHFPIMRLDDYEASKAGLLANLRRLRSDGEVVWFATTPNPSDVFVDVKWHNGRLIAWPYGCFMMNVDPKTGRCSKQMFPK